MGGDECFLYSSCHFHSVNLVCYSLLTHLCANICIFEYMWSSSIEVHPLLRMFSSDSFFLQNIHTCPHRIQPLVHAEWAWHDEDKKAWEIRFITRLEKHDAIV